MGEFGMPNSGMGVHVSNGGDVLMIPNDFITIEALAGWLGVKRSTLYQWTHTGRIPRRKGGRRLRFRPEAIGEWLAERRRPRARGGPLPWDPASYLEGLVRYRPTEVVRWLEGAGPQRRKHSFLVLPADLALGRAG